MPAASEQISAGVAPIHFVGAAIQAARCRLLAHRQSMSHRSASRSEGRKLANGRFHYRRSFDIPSVCRTGARTFLDEWQRSLATVHRSLFGSLCSCKSSSFQDRLLPRTSHGRSDSVHQFSCRFPRIPQIEMDDSCSPTGLIVRRPNCKGSTHTGTNEGCARFDDDEMSV
jgi:hypothetical protein